MAANDNLSDIQRSVAQTAKLVLLGNKETSSKPGGGQGEDDLPPIPESSTAYEQAVDKAVQSVAQTTAIAIQDASNMMRNVATVEVTAIGVATAKWIQNPKSHDYPRLIKDSLNTINDAAVSYTKIGNAVIDILEKLKLPEKNGNGKGNGQGQ